MKSNKLEFYSIISILLIYIVIFKTIVLEKFIDLSQIINLLFLFAMFVITVVLYGFKRSHKSLYRYTACQTFIVDIIIYYIVTYLLGLIIGFLSNSYSLSLTNIIKNIYLVIPTILIKELLRYNLLNKNQKSRFRIVIITIIFILLDVIMEINHYQFNNFEVIFKFVALAVIPAISSNILLSFTAIKVDYVPNFIYVMLMTLPVYILPVFPDLGEYFECMLGVILPFSILVGINNLYEKNERLSGSQKEKVRWYVYLPLIFFLLALIILVTGIFKYKMIAVISNSMYPEIKRGDAVILEKIDKDHLDTLKEGMIIVFKHGDRVIVHRITNIRVKEGEYYFKTKGDNNNAEDSYETIGDDVIGRVHLKVLYFGYPAVYMNEFLNAS